MTSTLLITPMPLRSGCVSFHNPEREKKGEREKSDINMRIHEDWETTLPSFFLASHLLLQDQESTFFSESRLLSSLADVNLLEHHDMGRQETKRAQDKHLLRERERFEKGRKKSQGVSCVSKKKIPDGVGSVEVFFFYCVLTSKFAT